MGGNSAAGGAGTTAAESAAGTDNAGRSATPANAGGAAAALSSAGASGAAAMDGASNSAGDLAAPTAGDPTGAQPMAMESAADGGVVDAAVDQTASDDVPEPMSFTYAWGFGIGVSDVPAAVDFYTHVMNMTVEKQDVVREDRTETVLYAAEAGLGSRLVLMKFNDDRETRKITAKLVWQASDASAVDRAASSYPDYVSRLNVGIVQFDGPETYIQEVGGVFDTEHPDVTLPYLIAIGYSVSDLAASRKFYMNAFDMEEMSTGTFTVTDATGTGSITEYTVRHADSPGIVLQDWTPDRNSKDNPVKVVLFVPDAQSAADKLVAAGGSVVAPAKRTPVYDNRLLIVAKDLDGYMIELVQ